MRHVLIIGGTRGIGRALAARHLERGCAVTVCGRHPEALQGWPLADHPALRVASLDIADAAAVQAVVAEAGDTLDALIVTAGQYFDSRDHALDGAATLHLLRTNVSGLASAFEAGAQRMLAQGHGRMAAVSSMAGLLKDYPGASVYGATKRAVLALCATYRKALAPFGIPVTALVPGYVDTERLRELNGGDASHKPFLMSEEAAVGRMLAAIDRGVAVDAFPWQMRLAVALLNLVPHLTRVPDFPAPAPPGGGAVKHPIGVSRDTLE
jgi:NAD(P)-dependent dehydrogenase (short-subunit alcohol dehydrogenase family)